jgi:hypothetical protein
MFWRRKTMKAEYEIIERIRQLDERIEKLDKVYKRKNRDYYDMFEYLRGQKWALLEVIEKEEIDVL